MKRLFILIGLMVIGFLALLFLYPRLTQNPRVTVETVPTPTESPKEEVTLVATVTVNGKQYAYSYFIVGKPENLTLLSNFTKPKDAQTLQSDYGCTSVINGGFYDKSNKPLGYFQSGDKVLGQRLESALFNGFVWAASGSAVISTELPRNTFDFALQTGPMLLFNGEMLSLAINNDSSARRMVAAKNDELIFLTVYDRDSVFDGPLLEDLPEIIKAISEKERLDISEAINLDGGSASVFYNEETSLSELTPVGSIFCLK